MDDLKTLTDLPGTIAGSSERDVATGTSSFVHFLNNSLRSFGTIDCHGATTLLKSKDPSRCLLVIINTP